MQSNNNFLNTVGDYSGAISSVVNLGLDYLIMKNTSNKINEMNQDLINRVSELDAESQERLKKELESALDDVAKTQVLIEFLEAEKEKKLVEDTKKKRILPLIGLGVGIILVVIVFYKLNKRNE